jgi:hypothetical protein
VTSRSYTSPKEQWKSWLVLNRLLSEPGLEKLCNIFTQRYAATFPFFDKQTLSHKLELAFKDEVPESYPPSTAFLALTVPFFEWSGDLPKGHNQLATRFGSAVLAKLTPEELASPSLEKMLALLM